LGQAILSLCFQIPICPCGLYSYGDERNNLGLQKMSTTKVIITGVAGFIGFHCAKHLAEQGFAVVGIDNLNDYYDADLKRARLEQLEAYKNIDFEKADVADYPTLAHLFKTFQPHYVIHLAAQAGVRFSITNPLSYADSNLTGFVNILEACRNYTVKHLIYASSSSVYGANTKVPFCETDTVEQPISLYAATKRANELMAFTYCHLYKIPVTGLRFFSVYGPWGRPDMAYFKFTKAIFEGAPIDIYNNGEMERDFTYIDDVVSGINKIMLMKSEVDGNRIYNIGNHRPVKLGYFIETLENLIGKKAIKNYLPMQQGDVLKTYAEIAKITEDVGFMPTIDIEEGLKNFVDWYKHWSKQKD